MTRASGGPGDSRRGNPGDGGRSRLTYRDAGVDRAAAAAAKQRIADLVRSTFNEHVVGELGGFGGGYRLELQESATVLVASADGVGTKLKVAVMAGVHEGVGVDLVAHCANDILTQGALPLFFLDYLALGRMDEALVEEVLRGVVAGCREVGAALIGGETAEMPGMYAPGEYDLAGFIVGRTRDEAVLDGSGIRPDDVLLGLASDGLHTNGYSLARKILFEEHGLEVHQPVEEWGCTVAEELLRPHRAYVAALRGPLERGAVLGLAHITGGGIPGNVPRVLPRGCGAVVEAGAWRVPPVFGTLQELGGVPEEEMWSTFNMGVGMVVAVRPEQADSVQAELQAAGERVFPVGRVVEGEGVELVGE